MRNYLTYFLLGISILMMSSCSIEKRLFNEGYYINWKNPIKIESTNKSNQAAYNKFSAIVTDSLAEIEDTILKKENLQIGKIYYQPITPKINKTTSLKVKNKNASFSLKEEIKNTFSLTKKHALQNFERKIKKSEENNKKPYEPLSVLSFAIALVTFLLLVFMFLLLINLGSATLLLTSFIIFVFTSVLSIVIGLIAVIKANKHEKRGSALAALAIMAGFTGLSLALFVLLILKVLDQ